MNTFWDERYASKEFIYGKKPNAYFKSCIDRLQAGKLLLPGEGEGRNAAYATKMGWDVFAFDQSKVAREKAMILAAEKGIEFNYKTGSLLDFPLKAGSFDMIALIYFHLFPEARRIYHSHLAAALIPGGTLMMEVFSKAQLQHNSGGPKDINLLYSKEELAADFSELKILQMDDLDIVLDEGPHHQGKASVIRLVAIK